MRRHMRGFKLTMRTAIEPPKCTAVAEEKGFGVMRCILGKVLSGPRVGNGRWATHETKADIQFHKCI